jgi:hypothetical protein
MTWQDEFQAALAQAIWEHGNLVNPNASYYGWRDFDESTGQWHAADCSLGSYSDLREDEWDAFVDTFYEGSTHHYGVAMTVTCACGKLKDRHIRWDVSVGEAIQQVLGVAGFGI